jgi:hypothetical protein
MFELLTITRIYDGIQGRHQFSNGYGCSVIRHSGSYGGNRGLFEVAVTDKYNRIVYDTPVTEDVLGYQTKDDVERIMKQISELPPK